MPRSTMLWRSSGSMTTLSASRIWSCVGDGMAARLILAEGDTDDRTSPCRRHAAPVESRDWHDDVHCKNKPAGPRRTPPAEGGEILHCQAGYEARQLFPVPSLRLGPGGRGGLPALGGEAECGC